MSSATVQPPDITPKKSSKIWIIILIVLLLMCCVCVVGAGGAAVYFYQSGDLQIEDALGVDVDELLEENLPDISIEPQEDSSSSSSDQEEPAEEESPNLLSDLLKVELGEEVSYPQCGYSFQKIPDYKFEEYGAVGESCNPAMYPIARDSEVKDDDPRIMLFGETGEDAQSTYDMVKKTLDEAVKKDDGLILSQETVQIDGVEGILFDQKLSAAPLKNRMIFMMVTPTQYFQITFRAPEEKFDELLPYFNAVVESITFSEPQPMEK
jgi:hypothetical protein